MASLIRIGVSRLLVPKGINTLFATGNEITCLRTISSKAVRNQDTDRPPKPAPWNYRERRFNLFHYLYDKTTARFDENSKIVVVEGPVAAGKTKFAKQLAEELDMLYLPEANLDMIYINKYGYDLRQLDEQLPESCRSFDINNFLLTPKHMNTAAFQVKQYQVKFSQYIDALAHVFSTGQGVVLDRCCYSDFVFAEAMYKQGYISKQVRKSYYEYRDNTIGELLRPHLVIYLDIPVKTVQENIQKRNLICEKNSTVLTPEYLTTMEKFYKQEYLKTISVHAELLVYDWSEGGDVEIVVEDVERINFKFDDQKLRFKDWQHSQEEDWAVLRHTYSDKKDFLMSYFNVPMFHVPELSIDGADSKINTDVLNNAPGEVYDYGFNKDFGDEGLLFKMTGIHRDTLALRERKLQ